MWYWKASRSSSSVSTGGSVMRPRSSSSWTARSTASKRSSLVKSDIAKQSRHADVGQFERHFDAGDFGSGEDHFDGDAARGEAEAGVDGLTEAVAAVVGAFLHGGLEGFAGGVVELDAVEDFAGVIVVRNEIVDPAAAHLGERPLRQGLV